jgi:uncharacterized tellurite resistance protein B-like protein
VLQSIRRFFQDRVAAGVNETAVEPREHALRLAAAALLFEVARADARINDEERHALRAAVGDVFGLSADEADELLALAEEESRTAASLYEFTRLVDTGFSPEQKVRLVELLWSIGFADKEKDAHEEHLVRRIADLLHVSHSDFIAGKIKARTRSGSSGRG